MENIKYIRRKNISNYLETQTVPVGGGDVDNLLKGANLSAYEVEIEGKRVVLVGFEPTD